MRTAYAGASLVSFLLLFGINAEAARPPARDNSPQDLLRQIQASARQRSYAGTFVYQQGPTIRTSRITHVWDGRNELEKIELLDGSPREFIRRNDQVTAYLPETRTRRVEQRVSGDLFPGVLANGDADLNRSYVLSRTGGARVAGYAVQGLALQPRDGWRYGYRLWADKHSGLLLRMQTLDSRGEVVEQIAFTELRMGHIDPRQAQTSRHDAAGWRVDNAHPERVSDSGWGAGWLPPGFKKIREVQRLVTEGSGPISGGKSSGVAGGGARADRSVTQIVYSDGLAGISVFIEPKGQHRTEGRVNQGAINIMGKRHGDYWITIVGEVPADTIRKIAEAVQHKPSR